MVSSKGISKISAFLSCLTIFLFILCIPRGIKGHALSASQKSSGQDQFSSLDGIVKGLYEAITFEEGKGPSWELFRSLFSPDAQLVRVAPDGLRRMNVESFISFFQDRINQGLTKSFYEAESARTVQSYGSIAQVFSTYFKGINTREPSSLLRGINSLNLYFDGQRWWISSLVWEDERPDNPIPQKYLSK